MLQVAGWVLGGYAAFHQAYATMTVLYKVRRPESEQQIFTNSKREEQIEPNIENITLPLCQRIKLYFHDACCCFTCCCSLSKAQAKQLKIIKDCQARIEEEFDIARLIEKQRDALYDLQLIKEKLEIQNDSMFTKVNPLGIVNYGFEEEFDIIDIQYKQSTPVYEEEIHEFQP